MDNKLTGKEQIGIIAFSTFGIIFLAYTLKVQSIEQAFVDLYFWLGRVTVAFFVATLFGFSFYWWALLWTAVNQKHENMESLFNKDVKDMEDLLSRFFWISQSLDGLNNRVTELHELFEDLQKKLEIHQPLAEKQKIEELEKAADTISDNFR